MCDRIDARKPYAVALVAVIWLCAAALPAAAQDESTAAYLAVTRARHDLHMGFTVSGLVSKVHVEPGDRIKAGDVLIELRHDETDALVALWDKRRGSTTAVDAAKARRDLAALEELRLRDLLARDGASEIEHRRAKLQLDLENLNVERMVEERDEAEDQYKQAIATRDRYLLKAPRDGVIELINVDEGELVETVQPVLQLVDARKLRLDVMVPTNEAFGLRTGDRAVVRQRGNPDAPALKGEIVTIANVADSRSGLRRAEVEVENTQDLPAGMHMLVTFTAREKTASADTAAD